MSSPAELVQQTFAQAQTYISDAQAKLTLFTNKLEAAIQAVPQINLGFTPVPDPGADTIGVYTPPADYTDSIFTTLSTLLSSRLAGGTGLPAAVENAIWGRGRDRETSAAQAAIDDVTAQSESLGWELPPGVLNEGVRRATNDYYDKLSGLSRDIAIKQADLEQQNMREAIEKSLSYETTLAETISKRSMVSVEAYKAEVERFKAQVEQDVKHWEAQIRQYALEQEYILNAARINTEIARANLATLLEAAKTGAQVYAQLVASAYSILHVQTSTFASAADSVSYQYSNNTDSAPPSVTAI